MMCWAPSATARRPEPQTWLMPQAALSFGRPALICAWRAGFWPCAAVSTWPRMVSETSDLSTPARSTTASMTMRPSSCAGVLAKEPRKLPTGVRAALAMTTLVMGSLSLVSHALARVPPGCGRAADPRVAHKQGAKTRPTVRAIV
jgi:hypothetical protein